MVVVRKLHKDGKGEYVNEVHIDTKHDGTKELHIEAKGKDSEERRFDTTGEDVKILEERHFHAALGKHKKDAPCLTPSLRPRFSFRRGLLSVGLARGA